MSYFVKMFFDVHYVNGQREYDESETLLIEHAASEEEAVKRAFDKVFIRQNEKIEVEVTAVHN